MLDITRLIRRAGRVPTGVDRVELAYLRHLTQQAQPFFAIARTSLGYVLLDKSGADEIEARLSGRAGWGTRDTLSRLARRRPRPVQRAESDLRRFALARCPAGRLGRMLTRHLPSGATYFNTGHSNITDRMLRAVHEDLQGRVVILLHDTIPLDYPHYQKPGMPDRFAALLRRVQDQADLVICNSARTRDGLLRHADPERPVPETVVAHLGTDPARPVPGQVPRDPARAPAYFVTVGTIEPRKRHDLLLDVWDDLARDMAPDDIPSLCICGARGWENEAVFRRLDQYPPDAPVREYSDLSDAAIAALLAGSRGLLFPSDAEGYGLPPVEAAALNIPVICQDLPVYHEILGDIPVYLNGTDRYQWCSAVKRLIQDHNNDAATGNEQNFIPPTWEDHFNTVLRLT